MVFNSYEFIFVFLPMTLVGFWVFMQFVGRKGALGWLILVSVAFHAYAGWKSLAVIASSVVLTFVFVRILLSTDLTRIRLRWLLLAAGVMADISLLGYFKYKNFFLDTANVLFETHFELSMLVLPLGISFLTFQQIAFLADVHSGQVKAVSFFDYALFTLFFPRTVAGPIIRYEEVMPQFANVGSRTLAINAAVGICLFSLGLFKKTVIADNLAEFVPRAFDTWHPTRPFLTAWSGVLAYTLQLYFDFSGYSDMALGAARLFGIRLPMNFNSPLKASSIIEFWSRWHITLTRFLTAYVYTPIVLHMTRARMAKGKPVLRGRRSALSAIVVLVGVPTLITMAISGIWHGAGWQFVVWGVLHGAYLTVNQVWRILRPRFWTDQTSYERVMKPLGWVLTFGSVVIAMVFFRARSVGDALTILAGMFGMHGFLPYDVQLLQSVGVNPLVVMAELRPFLPWLWIAVLLPCVMLLPNSLELLRRFGPALDFPEAPDTASTASSSSAVRQTAPVRAARIVATLCAPRAAVQRLRYEGIRSTSALAVIVALLGMLGVMAISSSGAFLYGQF